MRKELSAYLLIEATLRSIRGRELGDPPEGSLEILKGDLFAALDEGERSRVHQEALYVATHQGVLHARLLGDLQLELETDRVGIMFHKDPLPESNETREFVEAQLVPK